MQEPAAVTRWAAFSLLMTTTLLLLLLPAAAQAQAAGWVATDWLVICDPEGVWDGAPLEPPPGFVLTQEDCDSEGLGPAAHIANDLRQASGWLEGLGFITPKLRVGGSGGSLFVATIANTERLQVLCDSPHTAGCYYPGSGAFYVDQDKFFSMGHDDYSLDLDNFGSIGTATHELFHAVTTGYPDFASGRGWPDWITEGVAEFVSFEHLRINRGLNVQGYVRNFSHPLHLPANDDDTYRSWIFWDAVGSIVGLESNVAYLADIFADQDLMVGEGLAGVDAGLHKWGGLHALYPKALTNGYIRANADSAYDLNDVPLAIANSRSKSTDVYEASHRVRSVAANGYRVRPNVSGPAMLSVEVTSDEGAADLHVIVDDSVSGTSSHGRFVDAGTEEILVVVANVAGKAVDSVDRSYEIKIELRGAIACDTDLKEMLAGTESGRFQMRICSNALGVSPLDFDERTDLRRQLPQAKILSLGAAGERMETEPYVVPPHGRVLQRVTNPQHMFQGGVGTHPLPEPGTTTVYPESNNGFHALLDERLPGDKQKTHWELNGTWGFLHAAETSSPCEIRLIFAYEAEGKSGGGFLRRARTATFLVAGAIVQRLDLPECGEP